MTTKKKTEATYEIAGQVITKQRLKEIARNKTPSPKLEKMNLLLKQMKKNKANEKFFSQF